MTGLRLRQTAKTFLLLFSPYKDGRPWPPPFRRNWCPPSLFALFFNFHTTFFRRIPHRTFHIFPRRTVSFLQSGHSIFTILSHFGFHRSLVVFGQLCYNPISFTSAFARILRTKGVFHHGIYLSEHDAAARVLCGSLRR